MTTDEEHLRILSIFFYVVAGLAGLFSLLPLIHITIGVLMLTTRNMGPDNEAFGRLMGVMFIVMGGAAVLAGLAYAVCMGMAGAYLSQRRRYLFCLIMAALSCAFFPFGTILGIFTIVVLQKDSVRQLFPRT